MKLKYMHKAHLNLEDDANSLAKGFDLGFVEAVKYFNARLDIEIHKLEAFAVLTERRQAMLKMKETINKSLEEILGD